MTISRSIFHRLFTKPLMLIGMENVLSLIEENPITTGAGSSRNEQKLF